MDSYFYSVKILTTPDNLKAIMWKMSPDFKQRGYIDHFYVDISRTAGEWSCLNPHTPVIDNTLFIDQSTHRFNGVNNIYYRVRVIRFPESDSGACEEKESFRYTALNAAGITVVNNTVQVDKSVTEYREILCDDGYVPTILYSLDLSKNKSINTEHKVIVTCKTREGFSTNISFIYSADLDRWLAASYVHTIAIEKIVVHSIDSECLCSSSSESLLDTSPRAISLRYKLMVEGNTYETGNTEILTIPLDDQIHEFYCHSSYEEAVIDGIIFNSKQPIQSDVCNNYGIYGVFETGQGTEVIIPFTYSNVLARWITTAVFSTVKLKRILTAISAEAFTYSSSTSSLSSSSTEVSTSSISSSSTLSSESSNTFTSHSSSSESSKSSNSSSSLSSNSSSSDSSSSNSSSSDSSLSSASSDSSSQSSSQTPSSSSSEITIPNSYTNSTSSDSSDSTYDVDYEEYISNPEQLTGYVTPKVLPLIKSMLRGFYIKLKKQGGSQGFFLKRKVWGDICEVCNSYDLEGPVNGHCPECLGTGIVGGYHEGVPFWVFTSPEQGDRKVTGQGRGNSNVQRMQGECVAYPWIESYDIWVDAHTQDRYIINQVRVVQEVDRKPLIVMLTMTKLVQTAIEHKISIAAPMEAFLEDATIDYEVVSDKAESDKGWRKGLDALEDY